MRRRAFLGELVVPGLVLLGTLLFWYSLREAPSVSRRVPLGVMTFIVFMSVIVLGSAAFLARRAAKAEAPPWGVTVRAWLVEWSQRIAFIGLAIAYFYAFTHLGFSLANLLFLTAALLVAGYHRDRTPLAAAWQIALIALVATAAFHFLADIMDFNVPRGRFGF